MNKKSSNSKPNKASFVVSRLAPGTIILIESVIGTLYTIQMIDPFTNLVEFYSTAEGFRHAPPKRCYFYGSWSDRRGTVVVADQIIKDSFLQLKFQDADFLTNQVKTARLEGRNWHYDVIE